MQVPRPDSATHAGSCHGLAPTQAVTGGSWQQHCSLCCPAAISCARWQQLEPVYLARHVFETSPAAEGERTELQVHTSPLTLERTSARKGPLPNLEVPLVTVLAVAAVQLGLHCLQHRTAFIAVQQGLVWEFFGLRLAASRSCRTRCILSMLAPGLSCRPCKWVLCLGGPCSSNTGATDQLAQLSLQPPPAGGRGGVAAPQR